MKTIAKISEETLRLTNFLEEVPHGSEITYEEIENATGIKMDVKGKSYFRSACQKMKREYSSIKGIGVKMASAEIATSMLVKRLVGIDSAVRRGEKTFKNVTMKFYDELPLIEKKQANFIGSAFGAIRVAAEQGRKYVKESNDVFNFNITPVLPENVGNIG